MFTIKSDRAIMWPGFALRRGANDFLARAEVPKERWPALERLRDLGVVAFEDTREGDATGARVAELTERQLFALTREQLLELARGAGLQVADDTRKSTLLEQLKGLCKPLPNLEQKPEQKPAATQDAGDASPVEPEKSAPRGKRGGSAPTGEPAATG